MDVIIHMNLPLESLYLLKNRIKIRCVVLKTYVSIHIGADSGKRL